MAGEDLTNARLAAPPRAPLPADGLTRDALLALGDRVTAGTWGMGLPDWFWGEGVCLLGLVRLAEARGERFPPPVLQWLAGQVARGIRVDHVNHLAPGTALAMVPVQSAEAQRVLKTLVTWLDRPGAVTRDRAGALEHWPGGVWADTVFMAGVFLGRAAVALGDPEPLRAFAEQLLRHADVLRDPVTGLYAHGSHRGEVIRCYWGRANAWAALAAVEFLELVAGPAAELAEGLDAEVDRVRRNLAAQLIALARRQPGHGVWSVLVDDHPEVAGLVETSAAAGIGAAMLRAGAVLPSLPVGVAEAGWLAVRGALAYVEPDGTLARTSAGTVLQLVPFGYSVIRDDRPQLWGQGLALHAIAAALRAADRGEHP
ncbi:glycoside hydrolase family 105 protein [Pseudonocardia eucalypti]|uniref:Glycoside hydrolase family 105 protein n=1 Tax=Pseudonocardia eucalypti TaxID=648755 RepID=A0ABP9PXM0_9PSEU|nr:unsaturated rhamnogalacturonyl hydrolase [Pseudonocardia eucalypti]